MDLTVAGYSAGPLSARMNRLEQQSAVSFGGIWAATYPMYAAYLCSPAFLSVNYWSEAVQAIVKQRRYPLKGKEELYAAETFAALRSHPSSV